MRPLLLFLSFFVLVFSCFFSAIETALLSLSKEKTKALALQNPTLSPGLARWLVHPHEYLTLILAGNTLSNVLFATLVSMVLAPWDFLAWSLGTLMALILGETTPKFLARANPERTVKLLLPVLVRLSFFLSPVVSFLWRFVGRLVRAENPQTTEPLRLSLSSEDLKSLLDQGETNTPSDQTSVDMMQRVLELRHKTVESIMTPREKCDVVEFPLGVWPAKKQERLLDLIIEQGRTRTPVVVNGRMDLFVHTTDLLPLIHKKEPWDLRTLLRRPLRFSRTQRVGDALHDFRLSGVHAAFVIDDQGVPCGLVTLEDVMEEITGEILDEFEVT